MTPDAPPQASFAGRAVALPARFAQAAVALRAQLTELAGAHLLGLTVFGGKLADDPAVETEPLRSVAVLPTVDLGLLARLAQRGEPLGRLGLSAPLIMTPEHLAAARDVFPLELLEVQVLRCTLHGADHFAALRLDEPHVRLGCERELRSELLHLRQGLLASLGSPANLRELCQSATRRSARILRGVLFLLHEAALPTTLAGLIQAAAQRLALPLPEHLAHCTGSGDDGLNGFERFYGEVEALALRVDRL